MGVSTCLSLHARHRNGPHRRDDPRKAQARGRVVGWRFAASLIAAVPVQAAAEPIRIATFNVELSREGPGLLLRDILKGESADVVSAARVIAAVAPDVLVLAGFDFDHESAALSAFAEMLADLGADYPHSFSAHPNSGLATGLDLDGDGRLGGPRDAQGYGTFRGQGGLAVLSRWPVDVPNVRDFSKLLWRDLPGQIAPDLPADALDIQRLSTTAHWVVPVVTPDHGVISVAAFHATPPVFDGPEDRNGRRNHDETAFWSAWLDGAFGPAPQGSFVIVGDFNLDPADGDGRPDALLALLSDPRLQDPRPESLGAVAASGDQGGANSFHRGNPALDTADWDDGGPGNLRVDYVLPSSDWHVEDAGVFWPLPDEPDSALVRRSDARLTRHRLVWVDLDVAEGAR